MVNNIFQLIMEYKTNKVYIEALKLDLKEFELMKNQNINNIQYEIDDLSNRIKMVDDFIDNKACEILSKREYDYLLLLKDNSTLEEIQDKLKLTYNAIYKLRKRCISKINES